MKAEKIVQIAKRRGFIFPSSEIYGGLAGFYDYGPLGVLLKNKLIDYWRRFFLKDDNIWEIDSSLLMHRKVFEASGHLKNFVDPITQCKKCKSIFRADHLIEELTGKFVEGLKPEELTKIIRENNLKCPKCGGELEDVRVFNLMFGTEVGPVNGFKSYLRPETAQGIFVNFKNLTFSLRAKLPFGIAQVGKSYRNEISPRQWLIRLREFNQAEIEFFFDPENQKFTKFDRYRDIEIQLVTREDQKKGGKGKKILVGEGLDNRMFPSIFMAYFIAKEQIFYESLGIPKEAIRFRHMLPEETPHYSKGNFDLEIKFDFGWKEVVGNAYRGDYDLKSHMKYSGEDLSLVVDGKKIVPHVFEPSFGIDRTIYAIFLYNLVEDKKRGWDWFKFPKKIAPVRVAVYPLVNKNGLPEKAREIYKMLRKDFEVIYDSSGSIGRRYARADEIGVPFAITIDHETLKNNTVTIRDRDTTKQERVKIQDIKNYLDLPPL